MSVCGACQREIRVCAVCDGLLCVPGCVDRLEDGCMCEEAELVVDDAAEEEEDEEVKEEEEEA